MDDDDNVYLLEKDRISTFFLSEERSNIVVSRDPREA